MLDFQLHYRWWPTVIKASKEKKILDVFFNDLKNNKVYLSKYILQYNSLTMNIGIISSKKVC